MKISMRLSLILAVVLLLVLAIPVSAHPLAQGAVYQTPTPGPDGRILYKVQEDDTCLKISLLTGISTDQIRKLNNLTAECIVQPGQDLLLGKVDVTAQSPTPRVAASATAILPTSTPFNGTGDVCVFLYDDVNGDAMRQDDEVAIPDGAISLSDRSGKVSKTAKTEAGSKAVCFNQLPEGDYNLSVAIPQGYNPTTAMNSAFKLVAGDKSMFDFGAQLNSQAQPVTAGEGGRSPVLGVLGLILLLSGAGLGVYLRRIKR